MTVENRMLQTARAAQAALDARGVTMDRLTHAQQQRFADGLGVPLTDLHNAMRELRSQPRAAPKAPAFRERDVIGSPTDRIDEDLELRQWPGTLAAIDIVSSRMGLPLDQSPSLRKAYIEVRIAELYARGRVPDSTEDCKRAWQLYRRYEKIMRDGRMTDLDRRSVSDKARASLNRQAAAARATSRQVS